MCARLNGELYLDWASPIAFGLTSWFHTGWYIFMIIQKDYPNSATGFSFESLREIGYFLIFVIGMLTYPVEAITWCLLSLDMPEIDSFFVTWSTVTFWVTVSAFWIGPIVLTISAATGEHVLTGSFLLFYLGNFILGALSLFFFVGRPADLSLW